MLCKQMVSHTLHDTERFHTWIFANYLQKISLPSLQLGLEIFFRCSFVASATFVLALSL